MEICICPSGDYDDKSRSPDSSSDLEPVLSWKPDRTRNVRCGTYSPAGCELGRRPLAATEPPDLISWETAPAGPEERTQNLSPRRLDLHTGAAVSHTCVLQIPRMGRPAFKDLPARDRDDRLGPLVLSRSLGADGNDLQSAPVIPPVLKERKWLRSINRSTRDPPPANPCERLARGDRTVEEESTEYMKRLSLVTGYYLRRSWSGEAGLTLGAQKTGHCMSVRGAGDDCGEVNFKDTAKYADQPDPTCTDRE